MVMNLLFVILSPVGFFKTVGIIVVIYFVLKFVGRLLFPIVVKKAVNNIQARQSTYAERKPEGEVTIEKKPGQQRHYKNNEGEYVDFEEVE
jgi:hypothetical protein